MAACKETILKAFYDDIDEVTYSGIDLQKFKECDIRKLPVLTQPPSSGEWPTNFYLCPKPYTRILYIEINKEKKRVRIFDSFGGKSSVVDKWFQDGWKIKYVFESSTFHARKYRRIKREEFLNSNLELEASALHSIIFSLHLRSLASHKTLCTDLIAHLRHATTSGKTDGLRSECQKFQLQPLSNRCCKEFGYHDVWEREVCNTGACMK